MSRYSRRDVTRDTQWPPGFAPEEQLPEEVRRAERLRDREIAYLRAEKMIHEGAPPDVAVECLSWPGVQRPTEPSEDRPWEFDQWVSEASLAGDPEVCSMPVRGCPIHGDSVAWGKVDWRCRMSTCRWFLNAKDQRRHCEFPRVALIDYPSGHRRRVCHGHLASERAYWAAQPPDTTIRVTMCTEPVRLTGAAELAQRWIDRWQDRADHRSANSR